MQKINEIFSKVQQLQIDYHFIKTSDLYDSHSLKEKLLIHYSYKILTDILNCKENAGDNFDFLIAELKLLLQNNWQQIKGTYLAYTSIPQHPVTLLLIDLASAININENKSENSLQILMPTILSTESIIESFPDLINSDKKKDAEFIFNILNTHIVSDNFNYLLPIASLTSAVLYNKEQNKIYNPYYDYQKSLGEVNDSYISKNEKKRLLKHSALTNELADAEKHYDYWSKNKINFLANLEQFLKYLYFYSVNGIGQEFSAGEGVYAAIINFMDYYSNDLSPEEKAAIPASLKENIEFLLTLSSDPQKNANATQNIETCIAIHRSNINKSITQYRQQLMAITNENNSLQSKKMEQAEKQISYISTNLLNQLAAKEYTGNEDLSITLPLLNNFSIDLEDLSQQDYFNLTRELTAQELVDLCQINPQDDNEEVQQKSQIQQKILDCFSNLDDLNSCVIEMPLEKTKKIFTLLAPDIVKKFFYHPRNFLIFLQPLDETTSEAMLEIFFKLIFNNYQKFTNISLQELTIDQRDIFYQYIKNDLPSFVNSAASYRHIRSMLTTAQKNDLYENTKHKFTSFINSLRDCEVMFNSLTNMQKNELCSELKYKASDLIKSTEDFHQFFNLFDSKQKAILFSHIKLKLAELINNNLNFISIFSYLTSEQREDLFVIILPNLATMFDSPDSLNQICQSLTNTQKYELFKIVQDQLSIFIQRPDIKELVDSGQDLVDLCDHLNREEKYLLCQNLASKLPKIINSSEDFAYILENLTYEQKENIYPIIKNSIPDLIHSFADFYEILASLNDNQKNDLYSQLKSQYIDLITDFNDLLSLQQELDIEQCEEIYNLVKGKLQYFPNILVFLSPKYSLDLYRTHKEKINLNEELANHKIMHSTIDNKLIIKNCDIKNYTNLFEEVITIEEFLISASYFTRQQRIDLFNPYQFKLPLLVKQLLENDLNLQLGKEILFPLIQDSVNLANILDILSLDQCKILCASFDLLTIFINPQNIQNILDRLPPKKIRILRKNLIEQAIDDLGIFIQEKLAGDPNNNNILKLNTLIEQYQIQKINFFEFKQIVSSFKNNLSEDLKKSVEITINIPKNFIKTNTILQGNIHSLFNHHNYKDKQQKIDNDLSEEYSCKSANNI